MIISSLRLRNYPEDKKNQFPFNLASESKKSIPIYKNLSSIVKCFTRHQSKSLSVFILLFYKNYLAYLEGERMSTVSKINDIDTRSWKESLMLGVGRKFKIAKWMEMQALILFNLMYDPKDELYASPVVFKTGFRINP